MSNANTVELGEVCKVVMGQSPPSSSYNTAKNGLPFFQGKTDFGELYPTARFYCNEPTRVAYGGDILISVRAPVGPTNLAREQCCIGRGLSALQAHENLDPTYLLFFLRYFEPQLARLGKGSTFEAVNRDDLETLRIPLPTISEQKRIAGLLEQADRLRRTRRYALELSDTFLPAAFLELFGDPRQASDQWELDEFANLGTLDRGRSRHRPRNAPHLYGGPYPFIQTGDVTNAKNYIQNHSQTYSEEGLKQSKLWPTGTLCITIAANIAETAILTYPACFPDSVVGFIPNDRVKIEFVQFWLAFLQEILEKTAPESAQKNINLEILRELRCPVPPLPLQEKFATLVARHERLRATQREALRQAEHLFQTLLHRAFSEDL